MAVRFMGYDATLQCGVLPCVLHEGGCTACGPLACLECGRQRHCDCCKINSQ